MTVRYLLGDHVTHAMALAIYDKLDDGGYTSRIPPCKGVAAFGPTLQICEATLRSTLEEWIVFGLKLGHPLPVIDSINLNNTTELSMPRPCGIRSSGKNDENATRN